MINENYAKLYAIIQHRNIGIILNLTKRLFLLYLVIFLQLAPLGADTNNIFTAFNCLEFHI